MDILYFNESIKEYVLSKLYYFKVNNTESGVLLKFKDEFGEHMYEVPTIRKELLLGLMKVNPVDITKLTLLNCSNDTRSIIDTSASELNFEDTKKVVDWIKNLSNAQLGYLRKQYAAFYNIVINISLDNVDACKFFLNQWSPKVISDIMADVNNVKQNSEKRLDIDLT